MIGTQPWLRSSALLLLGLPAAVSGCGQEPRSFPNLVLITLDTFRADRLGALGHPGGLTPRLDALASEGALFENAITPIGTTHPSHASMFTGLFPGGHGVRFNGDPLAEDHQTLAERLSAEGFTTAGFVSKRSLFVRGGFEQGFDHTSDSKGDRADGDAKRSQRSGREVNRLVDDWLDEGEVSPLFLWVHYFGAHSPYAPTPHSNNALQGYSGPLLEGASTELFQSYGSEALPATALNRAGLEALYDGEISEVDRDVGALLDSLKRRGLLDNAIVIVVADHGQLLGEQGEVGHGFQLWEPVLRIPFLIWQSSRVGAVRIRQRVSLVDVQPTVLDLLDLAAPVTPGRSLVPALLGARFSEEPQFASVRLPPLKQGKVKGASGQRPHARSVAVYFGAYKLILDDERQTLFNVMQDRGEQAPLNLESAEPGSVEFLRPQGLLHLARERPQEELVDLAPEVLEEMRQLGYIE